MIFWILPVALTLGFLIWFLIKLLRQYDAESTQAALERIAEIEIQLQIVEDRLKTLETIESELVLEAEKSKEMPDSAESLSSGRKPLIE